MAILLVAVAEVLVLHTAVLVVRVALRLRQVVALHQAVAPALAVLHIAVAPALVAHTVVVAHMEAAVHVAVARLVAVAHAVVVAADNF